MKPNNKLKDARKAAGLSQRDLTHFVPGLNFRTLQNYEQGVRDLNCAAAITVYWIAKALDCKIEDLLDLDE